MASKTTDKTAVPYDTMSTKSVSTESMFSRCCCCIPLRTGCFILGYVSLVINLYGTIFFIAATVYCGLKTNGFDHVDSDAHVDGFLREMDKNGLLLLLGCSLVFRSVYSLIWLAINIACIVGIHMKRPGPIRVYVGIACFHLLLDVVWNFTFQNNIVNLCLEIGVITYFMHMYYIYARRLEKEALQKCPEVQHPTIDSYIYPTKLDKEHLVIHI